MKIEKIVVGNLQTNCYILTKNNKVLIIDPGAEPLNIEKLIQGRLIGIIITHYHNDHIGGLSYFTKKYPVPIYDYKNLKEGKNKIEDFSFEIIYTKGHHPSCITMLFSKENIMFTGDFIFKNDIGRYDLKSGNYQQLINSLNIISKFDSKITIYPGHGPSSTLKEEKKHFSDY